MQRPLLTTAALILSATSAHAASETAPVGDNVIAAQRVALAENSAGKGYGPQSPRDLETLSGDNPNEFQPAPTATEMHLCNIHFHENAEHRGGEFTTYAGNGKGAGTGFLQDGDLSEAELAPLDPP